MNFALRHTLAASLLVALLFTQTSAAEDAKPKLKGLIVAGGCCHDYPRQKLIISEGLSQRISIAWDIVHEGDENGKTHKVSVYAKPNWSDGYDVVIHNECFGAIEDVAFVEGIVNEHKRRGVPAVFVHCAMHSYRAAATDEWRKLIGVTSRRHEKAKRSLDVRNLAADNPIMAGFPDVWKTPNGELYVIENLWPNCTPLAAAYSPETESDQP
ncbi:MAG: ThuA domain-containing protein, partial [Planctomycetota bacterium]